MNGTNLTACIQAGTLTRSAASTECGESERPEAPDFSPGRGSLLMGSGHHRRDLTHGINFLKKTTHMTITLACCLVRSLQADPVIKSIEIERHPVFTGEDLHPVQDIANRWHITTREHVISNELLFAEGDPLDEQLLEETERNLRRLDYFESAEVAVVNETTDAVDVKVTTQDQWSLVPSVILESAGGLTRAGGAIAEYNLLGHGKYLYLDAIYESDVGTTFSANYDDPYLFGSNYEMAVDLRYGPLIESVSVSAGRPFRSLGSKWAYGADGYYMDRIDRLFDNGEEVSRLGANEHGFQLDGTRAWGERLARKTLKLAYQYNDESYRTLGDLTTTPLPDDEITGTLKTKFKIRKHRYVKETQIDYFRKVEDYSLGRSTAVGIGRAGFPIPIGESRWEYLFEHSHAFQLGDRQYLFSELGFTSESVKNTILDLESKYYFRGFDWQTFAVNFEFRQGWDLQTNKQFILGAESGLRGYPAREFNGDKLLLLNLESRQFWARRVLTVDLGSVLFLDIGNAWKRNESIDLSELNYAAGFGFRFGQSKLPGSTVVRLDLGWPLNNPGEMQVTLGIGQYFGAPGN